MQTDLTSRYLRPLVALGIVLATIQSSAVAQPRTAPDIPSAAVAPQPASEPTLDGLEAFITSAM